MIQVMYMYYLLGWKLRGEVMNETMEAQHDIASRTFILALDGDSNFEPPSVLKLIDLMKRDEQIGATCGRIHPVGSGNILFCLF